jgi:hypothetical protein
MKTLFFIIGFAIFFWTLKKLLPSPKKLNAATNALLAEHSISLIELVGENPFVKELKSGVVSAWRHSGFPNMNEEYIYERFNSFTRFQQLNILAMAFNELNQAPMLQGEFWQNVKNPLLPNLEDKQHINSVAARLKSKHGVDIHIPEEKLNIYDWDKKLIPEKMASEENDKEQNVSGFGHGTLVPNEVEAVFNKIDNYLVNFGDNKPETITLSPYEWALVDLSIRKTSDNLCTLHTHGWNNHSAEVALKCQADRCYCHRFLDDPEVREIAKTINNYLEAMGNNIPTSIPIEPEAKTKLNNRFNYFFDDAFNLDTNPNLAIQMIRVAGNELYKINNA